MNDHDNTVALGAHLRSWRMILGLTAKQVAERADISRDSLRRLENGKPGVSLDIVLAVTQRSASPARSSTPRTR